MKAKRSFLKQSDYNSYIFFQPFFRTKWNLVHHLFGGQSFHHNNFGSSSQQVAGQQLCCSKTDCCMAWVFHALKTMEVLHIPSINKKQLKMAEPQKNTQKICLVILPRKNPTSNKWSEAVFLPTLLTPDHFLEGTLSRSETEPRGFLIFSQARFYRVHTRKHICFSAGLSTPTQEIMVIPQETFLLETQNF